MNERREHLPDCCGCGHVFDGSEERVGDPVCHQQFELPVIVPLVFEHARVRLRCPACQRATLAALSAGALSGFGPRLYAHIAMLAGVFRLSRDQVRQTVVEVFGIPASKGSIDNAIMRMSAIMADPWAELRAAIQKAQAVHVDETTWRLRGAQQWLWVAASALVACYRIDPTRSQAAAKELLGEEFGGFVISDRYTGYHFSTYSPTTTLLVSCHPTAGRGLPALRGGRPPRYTARQARAASDRDPSRVPRQRP